MTLRPTAKTSGAAMGRYLDGFDCGWVGGHGAEVVESSMNQVCRDTW